MVATPRPVIRLGTAPPLRLEGGASCAEGLALREPPPTAVVEVVLIAVAAGPVALLVVVVDVRLGAAARPRRLSVADGRVPPRLPALCPPAQVLCSPPPEGGSQEDAALSWGVAQRTPPATPPPRPRLSLLPQVVGLGGTGRVSWLGAYAIPGVTPARPTAWDIAGVAPAVLQRCLGALVGLAGATGPPPRCQGALSQEVRAPGPDDVLPEGAVEETGVG